MSAFDLDTPLVAVGSMSLKVLVVIQGRDNTLQARSDPKDKVDHPMSDKHRFGLKASSATKYHEESETCENR